MIVDALRVFVTVAEQKNFSRAGALLNLSQPAVSLQIRNLENEMNAKLMHRSPKLVVLTDAGEILYRQAKQILSLYEQGKQDIQLLHQKVTGSIQIGASFTIGEYILPRLLAEFAYQFPEVNMSLTIANTEEIAFGLKANKLDLGLVEGEISQNGIEMTAYMKDEMILIASPNHPLRTKKTVKSDMLHDCTWILREHGSGTRSYSDTFIHTTGLRIKQSYVFTSSQGVKEAVAAGLGISILSRWIVRKELEAGEVVAIPLSPKLTERDFWIIQNKDDSSSMAIQMFIQKLLEHTPL
ncbi:LysR family transcriptional regulator [Paenibacillus pectinilyticus]|uniref:LysR family transcriptional regulator n=1 Tax=Paenibacillus pectinilyticus TaxID=512399 RepID=A0A1C1A9G3_9BACL|nr:LysR family transcriptional regulator [Paenibacillus pectinilyticus]OCT17261.1 LysR family transcriptional regulator [Paenibacillus pectinilyticus]